MNATRFLSIICAAALASALSHADDSPGVAKKRAKTENISQIDTNADGKISYEELKAKFPNVTPEKFKARDKNGDGFITPDERLLGERGPHSGAEHAMQTALGTRQPGQIFKQADKDGNGSVTLEELHAVAPRFPETRFKELDKNGDGAISMDEIPRPRPQGEAPGLPAKPGMEGVFHRADSDHDGKITFEELSAVAPKMTKDKFDKLDKNGDGAITSDEAPRSNWAGAAPDPAALARKADSNHDGKVTYEELQAVAPNMPRERFDQMDTNKDGVLSPEDRVAAQRDGKQALEEGVKKLLESDTNKDGSATFEEVTTAKAGFPREAFDRADRNKDGVISAADAK